MKGKKGCINCGGTGRDPGRPASSPLPCVLCFPKKKKEAKK